MTNSRVYHDGKYAHNLTDREMLVLNWISLGKKYEEIAAILGIEVNVVQQRVWQIKNKLGSNTTAGAVSFALRNGIIK